MEKAAPDPLQAIRSRIDSIDAELHRLLIKRSAVIRELIEIKGTSKPGAAFRPDREADMMRRLARRHAGALPLTTVEHIWREIITSFTAMQAPFGVAAGPSADPLAMRDAIRFYFGFSIPVVECDSAAAAIQRVVASAKEVAVIVADGAERWWDGLSGASAPKIFARLPFIEVPSRPAGLAAYVVGPPLKDKSTPDIEVLACAAAERAEAAISAYGGRVVARLADELVVELPVAVDLDAVAAHAGRALGRLRRLGGFFQPIRFLADRVE